MFNVLLCLACSGVRAPGQILGAAWASCLRLQTPNMAICDANLVDNMPKSLTAFGGLDALVHALESYVSVCATDYTKGEQTGRRRAGVHWPLLELDRAGRWLCLVKAAGWLPL